MAENKTKQTTADVAGFIEAVPNAQRRADAKAVCEVMARLSGEPPAMWGPSIIGFGRCHYKYESGREGDMPRIGFSPRSTALVFYLSSGFPGHTEIMERLGKHTSGKSCLYVKKLSDLHMDALEDLIAGTLTACPASAASASH